MTPWEAYWDALETLQLARRHGDEACVALAREEADDARDRCRWLGGFLVLLALEEPDVVKRLMRLTDELPAMASQDALQARQQAQEALEEVGILRKRHRGMEKAIADLTPGVGQTAQARIAELEARVEVLELLLGGDRRACRSRVAQEG